jgi:hypothetical protein
MTSSRQEPLDDHVYAVMIGGETMKFIVDAIKFYEELLRSDVAAIEKDPDLAALLEEDERTGFPIYGELERVSYLREHAEPLTATRLQAVQWTHGFVRELKSIGALYLRHLKERRNALAARENISKHALRSVDARISKLAEKINSGVFQRASCVPLLVEQLTENTAAKAEPTIQPALKAQNPRPIVLESIEIVDTQLRDRCVDLFNTFEEGQERNRLDTVVAEATRIFEERIRVLSGAQADCTGVALATFAFGTREPRLRVSRVPAEQDAAHALYRGAFGFIRNQVHHRLSGELLPERVLQVLGFIDYLIALAEGAEREAAGCEPVQAPTTEN